MIYIFVKLKFFKKFLSFRKLDFNKKILIGKKRNFFTKRQKISRYFLSKRLTFATKKRHKTIVFFKKKSFKKSNFLFKKFFFKNFFKQRKLLKNFFLLRKKIRQKKLTKLILKNSKKTSLRCVTYEYTILNILLRSHTFLFVRDAIKAILGGLIYINGYPSYKYDIVLNEGDCIQLDIQKKLYNYIKLCRRFLKKKAALFKHNAWKFYRTRSFKKAGNLKLNKRKNPKYLYLFFLFKLNSPSFLEIDYLTLSVFFLKKQDIFINTTYFLDTFSYKFFSMYNFKKIN